MVRLEKYRGEYYYVYATGVIKMADEKKKVEVDENGAGVNEAKNEYKTEHKEIQSLEQGGGTRVIYDEMNESTHIHKPELENSKGERLDPEADEKVSTSREGSRDSYWGDTNPANPHAEEKAREALRQTPENKETLDAIHASDEARAARIDSGTPEGTSTATEVKTDREKELAAQAERDAAAKAKKDEAEAKKKAEAAKRTSSSS